MSTIKLVGFLMLTTLWALIATYQWLTVRVTAPMAAEAKCNSQSLSNQVTALQESLEQAQKAQLEAESAKERVKVIYKPIKEVIHANASDSQCAGSFPDGVRDGLVTAASETNISVPAAEDR